MTRTWLVIPVIWLVFWLSQTKATMSLSPAKMPDTDTFVNSIGMKFVRIEQGTFSMGNQQTKLPNNIVKGVERDGGIIRIFESGDYDERPVHKVTITQPFYMAVTEVTNEQYEKFDSRHVHLRGNKGFSIDNNESVVFIDWFEATAFCEWLSKKEGLPYRLPTEAEWEYACRAGTTTIFHTGNSLPSEFRKNMERSWYPDPRRSYGRKDVVALHVGKTPPNPRGLYDVHGNVEEWCLDWYGPYEACYQVDPVGREEGNFKVTRGGSHSTVAYYLRSSNRLGTLPEDKSWLIGFRVVLGKMPQTKPLPKLPPALYQQNIKQGVPRDLAKGPEQTKPYFRGPQTYVKITKGSEGPLFYEHNHDPAIVECPNGDILAVWYTTSSERGREIAVAASRLRYGQDQWEPASPFWDAPDRNDHGPALWYDGDKTIYHFNALSTAATWGPLAIIMRTSIDNGATWSKARLIIPEHGPRHQVVESVFRTQEGYFLLPCDASPDGHGGTAIHISRDGGKTWTDPGGTIAGIHAGVAQLRDGRLLGFGRGDEIDGKMPMSISADMGKTWTRSASVFPPVGGGQRLVLLRLKEGPLLLVSFTGGRDEKPYMPITIGASGEQRYVTGMYAAVSYDEGQSWPNVRIVSHDGADRKVETTDGRPFTLGFSSAEPEGYLSICQAANGVVHLISSRQHYAFNLSWLKQPGPAERK